MLVIEPIYIIFVTLSIIACAPQLLQLVKVKQSNEFELRTWIIWFIAQVISTIYLLSLQTYLVALFSTAWMIFYAAMVWLILYYRYKPGGQTVPVKVTVDSDSVQ